MKYKAGDKFIIEIETHYNHSGEKNSARPLNDNDGANVSELYRIRGFKSLVFDADGLKKLEPFEDMTAEEYLNIKRYYCEKQFEKGWRVKDLPNWCLEDFRYPENSIEQIEHLRDEYKKAKYEADRMMDIRYDLEDIIAEYGIEDIRKALEQTMRQSKWFYAFLVMTAICATTLFIAFEPYMLFATIASAFFTITHKA